LGVDCITSKESILQFLFLFINSNISNISKFMPSYLGILLDAAVQQTQSDKFIQGVLATLLYGALGIGMAVLAFKIIDWIIPGDLPKQLADEHNVPLGIVAGAFILGLCIIIAAAIAS
jgi:uncharacterized membrane protein YjfL (UPF0719 family)